MADNDADLVAWLFVQVGKDEEAALAATAGPWRHNPDKYWRKPGTSWSEEAVFAGPEGDDAICVAGTGGTDDPQSMADATHIAAHDPTRVLAECEAKRQILAEHAPADFTTYGDQLCRRCVWDDDEPQKDSPLHRWVIYPCRTVRMLALPYADRHGYREEWQL